MASDPFFRKEEAVEDLSVNMVTLSSSMRLATPMTLAGSSSTDEMFLRVDIST